MNKQKSPGGVFCEENCKADGNAIRIWTGLNGCWTDFLLSDKIFQNVKSLFSNLTALLLKKI